MIEEERICGELEDINSNIGRGAISVHSLSRIYFYSENLFIILISFIKIIVIIYLRHDDEKRGKSNT